MANTFRTYLKDVIGSDTVVNSNRVISAGLDSFDTLSEYSKEDVNSLCRTLKKSPTNPMEIGPIVEKRLIHAASLAKRYDDMGRNLTASNLSRSRLKFYGQILDMVDALKEEDCPELEKVGP